jgi:D-beta-D-heptose 7-phosphate kinase/D-beta-D-heptose 1-phosphate adenosyltransferase
MEDLKKIIDSFPEKKILVIGDIMLDAWIRGIVRRVSPENQVPVLEWNGKMDYRLGGAANVAANVAALGGNVALAGFVGDDHEGNLLSDMLEKQGIKSYLGMNSVTTCKVRVEGK